MMSILFFALLVILFGSQTLGFDITCDISFDDYEAGKPVPDKACELTFTGFEVAEPPDWLKGTDNMAVMYNADWAPNVASINCK